VEEAAIEENCWQHRVPSMMEVSKVVQFFERVNDLTVVHDRRMPS
jgi:hypothetical protein